LDAMLSGSHPKACGALKVRILSSEGLESMAPAQTMRPVWPIEHAHTVFSLPSEKAAESMDG